jgi:hypothetical protein
MIPAPAARPWHAAIAGFDMEETEMKRVVVGADGIQANTVGASCR